MQWYDEKLKVEKWTMHMIRAACISSTDTDTCMPDNRNIEFGEVHNCGCMCCVRWSQHMQLHVNSKFEIGVGTSLHTFNVIYQAILYM